MQKRLLDIHFLLLHPGFRFSTFSTRLTKVKLLEARYYRINLKYSCLILIFLFLKNPRYRRSYMWMSACRTEIRKWIDRLSYWKKLKIFTKSTKDAGCCSLLSVIRLYNCSSEQSCQAHKRLSRSTRGGNGAQIVIVSQTKLANSGRISVAQCLLC